MAKYTCDVRFGGVSQAAFAEPHTSEFDIRLAVEEDLKRHYERRPEDLEVDMNISVSDCRMVDERAQPGEFDEEVEDGIWMQR